MAKVRFLKEHIGRLVNYPLPGGAAAQGKITAIYRGIITVEEIYFTDGKGRHRGPYVERFATGRRHLLELV